MAELIRRFSKVLVAVLAAGLTTAAAIVALLVVLSAQGQLSLTLLTPYLQDALSYQLDGIGVSIEDTVLSWNSEADRVDLQALRVRLTGSQGEEILEVPQLSVTLSAAKLMRGEVSVIKVAAIRPHLSLLRETDGTVYLTDPAADRRWPLLPAVAETDSPLISLGGLRHVAVVGATLAMRDVATGIAVTADGATVELSLEDGATVGRLTARLQYAGGEAAIGAGLRYAGPDKPGNLHIRFAELDLASLGRLLASTPLADLHALSTTVAGDVDLEIGADGGSPRIAFDLAAGPGELDLPAHYDVPLKFVSATVRGQVDAARRELSIAKLTLALPDDVQAEFSGAATRGEGGYGLRGKLTLARLPTGGIIRYWPKDAATGAREWVAENLRDGEMRDVECTLDLTTDQLASGVLPASAVLLTWRFSGVTSSYLDGLPPVRRGEGQGRLDAKGMHVDVEQAAVAGNLTVTEGKLVIPEFLADTPVLAIAFVARGPARSALELLDKPGLELASAVGIDPKEVEGLSATATRLRIPLLQHVSLKDVGFSAASTLSDIRLRGFWQGRDIEGGQMTLRADVAQLKLEGKAVAGGLPVEFAWNRRLDTRTVPDSLELRARFPAADLRLLGIDTYGQIEGAVAVRTTLTIDPKLGYTGPVEIDLADAAFAVPMMGIRKRSGEPAVLTLNLTLSDDGAVAVPDFQLRSPMLEIAGNLQVPAGGKLRRIRATRVAAGTSRFAADLKLAGDGSIDLAVTGDALDIRPAGFDLANLQQGEGDWDAGWPAGMLVKADLRKLYLSDAIVIDSATLDAQRQAGEWLLIDFNGRLNGVANTRLVLRGDGLQQQLTFASDDAGTAMRAFGIYDRMHGGRIAMKAAIRPAAGGSDTMEGTLRVDDFTLIDNSVLAQILTLGSLTGISDTLGGKGIAFSRLELPFTKVGKTIESERVRAIGPAIGITGKLRYDQMSETIEANGTLVPAYTINSVLGRIPLIGNILVGREDEGIFAMTFQVDGSIEQPRVSVNPLSALAPGFLRRIVEGLERPTDALDDDMKLDMPGVHDQRP